MDFFKSIFQGTKDFVSNIGKFLSGGGGSASMGSFTEPPIPVIKAPTGSGLPTDTYNPQGNVYNPQPTTFNPQSPTFNPQTPTFNPQTPMIRPLIPPQAPTITQEQASKETGGPIVSKPSQFSTGEPAITPQTISLGQTSTPSAFSAPSG